MKRLRFLLLDANVVIKLFELRLWEKVVERCDVLVPETVAREAQFCFDESGQLAIDLVPFATSDQITIVGLAASEVTRFLDRFTPDYLERLDPGEAEALAYLLASDDPCLLSSSDSIVFKVLGLLQCGEQGISLEEILQAIGLSTALPDRYGKAFRERWTKQGQQDMIRGIGLKH